METILKMRAYSNSHTGDMYNIITVDLVPADPITLETVPSHYGDLYYGYERLKFEAQNNAYENEKSWYGWSLRCIGTMGFEDVERVYKIMRLFNTRYTRASGSIGFPTTFEEYVMISAKVLNVKAFEIGNMVTLEPRLFRSSLSTFMKGMTQ
jgi:hypothetical protein